MENILSDFESLNTIYTFMSCKCEFVITFESIQSSLEQLSKKKWTVKDVGALKAIAPALIHLVWMKQEDMIDGKIKGMLPSSSITNEYKLVIEFRDSGISKIVKKQKTKSNNIQKTIQRRRTLFEESLSEYIQSCKEKNIEPGSDLTDKLKEYLPCKPTNTWNPTSSVALDMAQVSVNVERPRSLERLLKEITRESFYVNQMSDTLRRSRV